MNKHGKICILTTVHNAQDGRIFHKEAKSLARAGYDVTLIGQSERDEVVDGVRILALRKPKSRIERFFSVAIVALLKSINEKANVYHFHDPELIPIGLILKILGKKVIYDVHEDYGKSILAKHYIPMPTRRIISSLANFFEKTTSILFDAIVTVIDDILKKFSGHRRAVVLNNYPTLSGFALGNDRSLPDEVFKVFYAGVLSEERGVEEMVRAMEHLSPFKNIKLTLCGPFSSNHYEEKIRSLPGFEKVEYLGIIKQEDVWQKMLHANAGIVSYHPIQRFVNTRPTKLFDYMAAQLPIISSNFPLWADIIKEHACGITVDPLNPKEIAEAIQYLMENPDKTREMRENGRKAVLGKYSWQNEEKKLLKLYRDLITA